MSVQENVEEMPGAMMLVGNKVDLEESSEREVSTETGETFAKVSPRVMQLLEGFSGCCLERAEMEFVYWYDNFRINLSLS